MACDLMSMGELYVINTNSIAVLHTLGRLCISRVELLRLGDHQTAQHHGHKGTFWKESSASVFFFMASCTVPLRM